MAPIWDTEIETVEAMHLKKMQERLLKTPTAARYFGSVCSVLFSYARFQYGR